MFGISTCWWHGRTDRGDEILDDILRLGFPGVELEYRITESLYKQMKPLLQKALKVLSIHNFFPKPDELAGKKGGGDLFLLSSTDRDERRRAVAYTIRTLEHAHELGAEVVILHLGHVDMPGVVPRFSERYQGGKRKREEPPADITEQRIERKSRQQKNLDAVLLSLDELNREAATRNVFLGIENRYHFNEIPDFEEIGIILKAFEGGHIRYWHDMGHAGAQENMGLVKQEDLLNAYADRLIGIHLHDVKGLDDHLPPGKGEMNFEKIKVFLKPSHLKILEVHPKVDRKDLLEGIEYVRALGM
jgi:sugar phosphate isomerase/epimerase